MNEHSEADRSEKWLSQGRGEITSWIRIAQGWREEDGFQRFQKMDLEEFGVWVWSWPPIDVQIPTPATMNMLLSVVKRDFVDVIKAPERKRLSWVISVSPVKS